MKQKQKNMNRIKYLSIIETQLVKRLHSNNILHLIESKNALREPRSRKIKALLMSGTEIRIKCGRLFLHTFLVLGFTSRQYLNLTRINEVNNSSLHLYL